jgi:hypothetical protein
MYIGAIGMNTIVTFVLLFVVLVTGFVTTYPDPPLVPLLLACVATAGLFPLAFYPVSKTLWLAIDVAMSPLEPGEADPPWAPPPEIA